MDEKEVKYVIVPVVRDEFDMRKARVACTKRQAEKRAISMYMRSDEKYRDDPHYYVAVVDAEDVYGDKVFPRTDYEAYHTDENGELCKWRMSVGYCTLRDIELLKKLDE